MRGRGRGMVDLSRDKQELRSCLTWRGFAGVLAMMGVVYGGAYVFAISGLVKDVWTEPLAGAVCGGLVAAAWWVGRGVQEGKWRLRR